jgi:hypothetical protein
VLSTLSRAISGGPAAEAIPGEPFDAVGIGWSVEDDAPLVHAAYHFDSDDAAADAVDALETGYRDGASVMTGQPFSERFTVESAEATGPVVLITVTPTDEGRVPDLYQALIVRDSIFISP